MELEEQHRREANIGAHLAWSAAFLASGRAAEDGVNVLAAAFSYYYAIFHAGFAWLNTDHSFHMKDMERIHHNKIEGFLENNLPLKLSTKAKALRETREFLSYLGAGDPHSKVRIVRGAQLNSAPGTSDVLGLVGIASRDSEVLFEHIYSQIETFCVRESWQPLKSGRTFFVDEYLDDDVFLNIFPRDEKGIKIARKALAFLVKDA